MQSPELSISVGELIGVPRVTLRGSMDGWHDQALSGVLKGFEDEGAGSLVLDMAGLLLAGVEGATSLINALRAVGPGLCVHVVACSSIRGMLERARLGPCLKLYSSTDEIAEYLGPIEDYLTSRWLAATSEDEQLPLAA